MMNKLLKKLAVFALASAAALAVALVPVFSHQASADDKSAGQKLDETTSKMSESAKTTTRKAKKSAKHAGKKTKDAAEDAGKKASDAAHDAGDRLEKQTQ